MKQDNHTIEEDITELKQRFDTSPKMLVKLDYKHLIHTIEHVADGDDKLTQWRCDTLAAVSKKKSGLKYTADGFAIADKTLSGRGYFYINEVIAIPNTDNVESKVIQVSANKIGPKVSVIHIFNHFGYEKIPDKTIFILKTKPDENGSRPHHWDGQLDSLDLIILGTKLHKIFVKHHSQKYIDGRRTDYIHSRHLRADSRWGTGQDFYPRFKYFCKSTDSLDPDQICIKPGIRFSCWGYNSHYTTAGLNTTRIGWRKLTSWCRKKGDGHNIPTEEIFQAPLLSRVLQWLDGSHMPEHIDPIYNSQYILVKVDVDDPKHGCVYLYKFYIQMVRNDAGSDALKCYRWLTAFVNGQIKLYEDIK